MLVIQNPLFLSFELFIKQEKQEKQEKHEKQEKQEKHFLSCFSLLCIIPNLLLEVHGTLTT